MPDGLSIRAAATTHGDAVALVEGERETRWAELAAEVEARARALAAHGLGASPDARVAVLGDPVRERVIDVLAAIELGAPLVMLHPRWTDAERAAVLTETQPRVVLGTEARGAGEHAPIATVESAIDTSRTLAILYTSGTTGRAKGAILSRRAFLASARASAASLPLEPGDRWLLTMTLAHVGGLSIVVRSLIARSTIVLGGTFDVDRTIETVTRDRPTTISLVPTMLGRLLDAGWTPPPELRAILLGGAACPDAVLTRAIEAGLPIRTTYGLTEACSQVATARHDVRSRDDGAGAPLPGTGVRVGAEGTIQVRGPTMFDGWFPPDAHPSPFDADGWYDTGDLGELDARGRLHVLARRSDLIVTGGENVYPAEVEAALERVEGVRAACVFGVDDDHWGQLVAAAIVVDRGGPSDAMIFHLLSTTLSRFKIPKRIARVSELATGSTGKLDRRTTAERTRPALLPLEERHD